MTELFAPYPQHDGQPVAVLVELVRADRESLTTRASAVAALGRRTADDLDAVAALEAIAADDALRATRMFHLTSLAWLAVAGLANGASIHSTAAARRALARFDEPERSDIDRFLRSGGFAVDV